MFHRVAYSYSCSDWDDLHSHLRDVPWEDIFKLNASDATSEFCEWVQVGIDVCIPHFKYQVKPHSPPWFSVFRLFQQNKSIVKFRQASIVAKGFLKLPMHMLLKQKSL